MLRIAFTVGQPYDVLIGLPGYPPIWGGRFSALTSHDGQTYFIKPSLTAPPATQPDQVVVGIVFYSYGSPPPCDDWKDIRVTVKDHPEAKTHYWLDGVAHDKLEGVAAQHVTIDNLPADTDIVVQGEKDGCDVETYWWGNKLKHTRTHRGHTTNTDMRVVPKADAGADAATDG
jgi:hypothetical protein